MAKESPDAKKQRLQREELERLAGEALPNRENMSLISLGGSGVLGGLGDPLDPGATPDVGGDVPTGTEGTGGASETDGGGTDAGGADATPTGIAGTVAGLAGAAADEASTDADGSSTVGDDGTISSHDTASSET
jgi:hypothetical protein